MLWNPKLAGDSVMQFGSFGNAASQQPNPPLRFEQNAGSQPQISLDLEASACNLVNQVSQTPEMRATQGPAPPQSPLQASTLSNMSHLMAGSIAPSSYHASSAGNVV